MHMVLPKIVSEMCNSTIPPSVTVMLHLSFGLYSFGLVRASFPHPAMTRFSSYEYSPYLSELGHKLEYFLCVSAYILND